MGTYLNPFPGLKLRHTKRGWRAGVGPRWFRSWFGAGGRGTSTGFGPFSWYRAQRRTRGPCQTCGAGRRQPCRSMADNHELTRVHNGRR